MIDESLLRSNFIGRDGFRWWIGQVAPFSENQEIQNNGGGWGNRAKVRIIGYHPFNEEELSNDDLPWAQILLPTTAGSGGANVAASTKLRPSDSVFGFFLDGDNAQLPVIMGVFGRTSEVESNLPYTLPFKPYTGYTGRIEKPDGSTMPPSEANESNTQAQKSPRRAPPEVIEDINANIDALNANLPENTPKFWKETTYYTGIGNVVPLGSPCNDTSIGSIVGLVNNLVSSVTGLAGSFLNVPLEISKTVSAITAAANSIVGNMFSNLAGGLITAMTGGLANLYNTVFASTLSSTGGNEPAAVLAGVAAQTGFLEPVKAIQDALFCGIGAITNSLGSVIEDLINSVLENAQNFVSCIGTQFVSSLIGSIASKIENFMGPLLEGVSDILGEGFDILGTVTSGIDAISNIASFLDCGQSDEKCDGMVEEYVIGKSVVDYIENTQQIVENAKISAKIGEIASTIGDDVNERLAEALGAAPGTNFGLPNCDSVKKFEPPSIKIFGGGTARRGADTDDNRGGATAEPIMGAFAKNADGRVTGSIIGVKITNPGKNYKYPPFVQIVDPSNTGFGAEARAILNYSDGSIRDIYIKSIGENYPIGIATGGNYPTTTPGGSILVGIPTGSSNVGVGTTITVGISSIIIVKSGIGYSTIDYIVDNENIQIGINTVRIIPDSDGRIIGFSPDPVIPILNGGTIEIRVNSSTGSGAVLKPSIGIITAVSKLTQIIDCI